MPQRIHRALPVMAPIGVLSDVTGMSKSAIERAYREDETFPRPFKLRENGDRMWLVAEVLDWISLKAGRRARPVERLAA